jgi:hypothetical protein
MQSIKLAQVSDRLTPFSKGESTTRLELTATGVSGGFNFSDYWLSPGFGDFHGFI